MSQQSGQDMNHGDDSFLDIVANLVGVMIILVVVLGVQSHQLVKDAFKKEVTHDLEKKISSSSKLAGDYYNDMKKYEEELRRYAFESEFRRTERDALLQKNILLKEKLDESQLALDQTRAAELDQFQIVSELNARKSQLTFQLSNSTTQEIEPVVLQHLPTPMAKTVFSKELHLVLSEGRVAVIPWDQLVDSLKRRVRSHTSISAGRDMIHDHLEPIEGFQMEYHLRKRRGVVGNGRTQAFGEVLSLELFELEITDEAVFETVEDSLRDGGRLAIETGGRNPRELVLTVWTYPDSFQYFRTLKEELFRRGFLTAARPIPAGMRIGAAPQGSKSIAQ